MGGVRRILTIFLFVAYSYKVFGIIFGIYVTFLDLVGTRRVYLVDRLLLQT